MIQKIATAALIGTFALALAAAEPAKPATSTTKAQASATAPKTAGATAPRHKRHHAKAAPKSTPVAPAPTKG